MTRPREFWLCDIDDEFENAGQWSDRPADATNGFTIHVIEKSVADKLAEALEFYAQKTNLYGEKSSQYNSDYENYRILADKGNKAKEALKIYRGD